jgi:hypothetical protein
MANNAIGHVVVSRPNRSSACFIGESACGGGATGANAKRGNGKLA